MGRSVGRMSGTRCLGGGLCISVILLVVRCYGRAVSGVGLLGLIA
jgi:hypothetical protein